MASRPPNDVIVRTYDRVALPYDWFVSPTGAGSRRRALSLLDVGPCDDLLDLGCGPEAAITAIGASIGPAGSVIGLDAAEGMVERARRRVRRAGLVDRVTVVRGDARNLPFRSGWCDVVLLEDTLELFEPEVRGTVLRESARMLGEGGRLCAITMEREGHEAHPFYRIYEFLMDSVPGVDRFGCRPIDACQSIEAAGFTVLHREQYDRGYVWPTEIIIAEWG